MSDTGKSRNVRHHFHDVTSKVRHPVVTPGAHRCAVPPRPARDRYPLPPNPSSHARVPPLVRYVRHRITPHPLNHRGPSTYPAVRPAILRSHVFIWEQLKVKTTAVGQLCDAVNLPSATFEKFESPIPAQRRPRFPRAPPARARGVLYHQGWPRRGAHQRSHPARRPRFAAFLRFERSPRDPQRRHHSGHVSCFQLRDRRHAERSGPRRRRRPLARHPRLHRFELGSTCGKAHHSRRPPRRR